MPLIYAAAVLVKGNLLTNPIPPEGIGALIAAVVVAFTAFFYAELSTHYPVSAGEAAYVEAGFNAGWLATRVGLAVALSGTVSAAAVAIGAAS